MTIGMRNRQALGKWRWKSGIVGKDGPEIFIPAIKAPVETRSNWLAGFLVGLLTALVIVGLMVDAFVRPAYWIGMR